MKDLLKMVKKHILITSIAGIVLGLVLVCVPGVISDALCYVLAGACMLYGIFSLVSYFRQRIESQSGFEFVFGVIAIVAGIFVCVNVAFIKGIISWILSIAVIIVGTFRLQQAIDLARMHDRFQWAAFVMAGITLVYFICNIDGYYGRGYCYNWLWFYLLRNNRNSSFLSDFKRIAANE